MASVVEVIGSATIPNGAAASPAVVWTGGALVSGNKLPFGACTSLVIYGPSALTNAVTVQVDYLESGQTWYNLTEAGGDVTVPAAKAKSITPFLGAFKSMRFNSAGNEGANRLFVVVAVLNVSG